MAQLRMPLLIRRAYSFIQRERAGIGGVFARQLYYQIGAGLCLRAGKDN